VSLRGLAACALLLPLAPRAARAAIVLETSRPIVVVAPALAALALAPRPTVALTPLAAPASRLVLRSHKHAAAFEEALALARTTRAGRHAIAEAERILAEREETLPINIRDLGKDWGGYDYFHGRMQLSRELFKSRRRAELAEVVSHELLHFVQHAQGLPSNALELEIEAHLQSLEIASELGTIPGPNTFSRQSAAALRRGPAAFIALIQSAVPNSVFLTGSSLEDVIDELEDELGREIGRAGRRALATVRVLERDIATLNTAAGRAAYARFSRRVMRRLRRRAGQARLATSARD
jgi:hypothetical protein